MSDIVVVANRIIPITVELYKVVADEFLLDPNIINKEDSEYKLLFTCQNKNATSPFAVANSDLSNTDKQEIVFTTPGGDTIVRKATFEATGSDGEVFYICQLNDMNTAGIWQARPRMTEGDVEINWPNTPFRIE